MLNFFVKYICAGVRSAKGECVAIPEVDDPKARAGKGGATDWVAAFQHGDLITPEATLTAHSAAAVMLKNDPYEYETEEERARKEHEKAQAMAGAANSFRNAIYSFGNYNISFDQASASLRGMEQDIDSSMEVNRYFNEMTQKNVAYNPDGTPMTRAQITAYEDSISACTILSTQDEAAKSAADMAAQEAQAAAMKEEIARFNRGEITDINALSVTAQAAIIEDRIKAQLAAGETVNLRDVPQHLRANAIDLILSHEDEAIMTRALQTEGLTVQQWRDGILIENAAVGERVMDKHSEFRDARRTALYAEAGLDPNAPAAAAAVTVPQGGLLGALNSLSSKSSFNSAASGETLAAPTVPLQEYTTPRTVAAATLGAP